MSFNSEKSFLFPEPDLSILDPVEKIIFSLRALYCAQGYKIYRMSKFEEYDLYVRNKDYLISDGIITFTDTNGRLMALKPDVTLSIIKNTKDNPDKLKKLCYNENVYRVSKNTDSFREIMQTGIECLGNVDEECIAEVISLAARSLQMLSEEYVIELSQLDILSCFIDRLTDVSSVKKALIQCVSAKNVHGIRDLAERESLSSEEARDLICLVGIYGNNEETFSRLDSLCRGKGCDESLNSLNRTIQSLKEFGCSDRIVLDFSSVNDLKYYNGITFKGFINGIPGSVISGGQYDNLMKRMQKRSKAVGFAVYLDMLDGHVI